MVGNSILGSLFAMVRRLWCHAPESPNSYPVIQSAPEHCLMVKKGCPLHAVAHFWFLNPMRCF